MPTVPAMLFSIGWLTSDSTNSAESPGDSVWMMIWVGENSGKTSRLLRDMLYKPYSMIRQARLMMTPLKRMEKRTRAAIMLERSPC